MTSNLERQFEEGLEVLETIKTPGYKILEGLIENEILRMDRDIERANKDLVLKAGETDANLFVQGLIKLQSRKDGLRYIINQAKGLIEKKDKANNKLNEK